MSEHLLPRPRGLSRGSPASGIGCQTHRQIPHNHFLGAEALLAAAGRPPRATRGLAHRGSVHCQDFNLATTLASGQVFRWRQGLSPPQSRRADPKGTVPVFMGWIGPDLVRVAQKDARLTVEGTSGEAVERFFSLDVDLPALTRQMDVDPVIHAALQSHRGLRLIRQEPWECLAGFILSAYNNIPRLTGMLDRLALRFGEPPAEATPRGRGSQARSPAPARPARYASALARPSGFALRTPCPLGLLNAFEPRPPRVASSPLCKVEAIAGARSVTPQLKLLEEATHERWSLSHRFPRAEALAQVSERTLRNCGLGFRAPYLKAAAQAAASGAADLEGWRELEDEALRRALLTIPGVGEKVVECVMLFAYGRTGAFPVDVWIGRAMREWYFRRRKVPDRKIREFARRHFGPHCGWAQQYLYCHARASGKGFS